MGDCISKVPKADPPEEVTDKKQNKKGRSGKATNEAAQPASAVAGGGDGPATSVASGIGEVLGAGAVGTGASDERVGGTEAGTLKLEVTGNDLSSPAGGEDVAAKQTIDAVAETSVFDAPEGQCNIAGFRRREKRKEWKQRLQDAQNELQKHQAREYDAETVRKVLNGEIFPGPQDKEVQQVSRVLRAFISSTFTDTAAERDLLIDDVYPYLRGFAEALSMDFQQPSEMRWGIRAEASANHETSVTCMREIERCQRESCGINYVLLLGDKYGFRPPPSEIPKAEFETLLAHVSDSAHKTLLSEWYIEDTSKIPPEYVLQSSSRVDSNTWWNAVFPTIQTSLRCAAELSLKHSDVDRYNLYVQSVTSEEIYNGLFKLDKNVVRDTVVYYKRTISNLTPPNKKWVDMLGDDIDTDAQTLLATVRDHTVPAALTDRAAQMREFTVEAEDPAAGKLIDVKTHCSGARPYLQQFSDDFAGRICDSLLAGAKRVKVKADPVYEEALRHNAMARVRLEAFIDTEETASTLQRMQAHFSAQGAGPTTPLVLHGESGSGKTSLVAAAACRLPAWTGAGSVTIVRFLGSTAGSSAVRMLLRSILMQLHRCGIEHESNQGKPMADPEHKDGGGPEDAKFPEDMHKLAPMLAETLAGVPPTRRVNLVLDSLDQLSDENRGRELKWLPVQLPAHVRMLVSTLPAEGGCLEALRAKLAVLPEGSQQLVQVLPFSPSSSEALLRGLQAAHRRALPPDHVSTILERCACTRTPLFLVTLFADAKGWRSYKPAAQIPVAMKSVSMPALINCIFDKLASTHGKTTVNVALGLLSAARFGLTNNEMEDLLSLDDAVLKEVFEWWTPPVKRLPPLLWARITTDLSAALVRREAESNTAAPVVTWYHRQFRQTAEERFLDLLEARELRYRDLAAYFSGSHPAAAERKVNLHPNFNSGGFINARKMAELPHALRRSGGYEALARELCDLEFVEMSCHVGYAHELVGLYQETVDKLDESADTKALLVAMQAFFCKRSAFFAQRPADVFPEAFNLPDADPVQQLAQADFDAQKFTRPFFAWSNKKQATESLGDVAWMCEITETWTQAGAWAPDSTRLICGYDDGLGRIWNTSTGECEHTYRLAQDKLQITHVNWGPGDVCVVGGDSGQVYVFGAKHGNHALEATHATDVHKSSFASPSSGSAILLATTGRNNTIQLFRVEHHTDDDGCAVPKELVLCAAWENVNGDPSMPRAPPPKPGEWVNNEVFVKGIAFNPSRRTQLLTVSTDNFWRVWELDDGERPTQVTNTVSEYLPRACDKCDWAPDGAHFVVVCIYLIQVFDTKTFRSVFTGPQMMSDAKFSMDSQYLLVMARLVEHRIDIRAVDDLDVVLYSIDTEGHQPRWMSLPPDMHAIASGDSSGFVKLFDISSMDATLAAVRAEAAASGAPPAPAVSKEDAKHFDWVTCVKMSGDGQHVVTGGNDHTVRLWSLETGKVVRVFERSENAHDQVVDDLAISSDGAYVATGGRDDKLCIWEAATGELLIVDQTERPKGLCWLPAEGRSLLFRSVALHKLQLWDVAEQKALCTHTFGSGGAFGKKLEHIIVATALIGPDNLAICVAVKKVIHKVSIVTSGSGEKMKFKLEEPKDKSNLMEGHSESITTLDASQDGSRLLSGSWDQTVRVWDVASCECLFHIKGVSGRSKGLLTNTGAFAITSGVSDSILHLWELVAVDDDVKAKPVDERAIRVGSYTTFDENGQFICLSSNYPYAEDAASIWFAAGTGGGDVKMFSMVYNPPQPQEDEDQPE